MNIITQCDVFCLPNLNAEYLAPVRTFAIRIKGKILLLLVSIGYSCNLCHAMYALNAYVSILSCHVLHARSVGNFLESWRLIFDSLVDVATHRTFPLVTLKMHATRRKNSTRRLEEWMYTLEVSW